MQEANTEGWLVLHVTLTTEAGKPVSNHTVSFSHQVEFFGSRQIEIGTATTDAAGIAAVAYQPAELGVGITTVGVWGVLLGVFALTVRGIWVAGRRQEAPRTQVTRQREPAAE